MPSSILYEAAWRFLEARPWEATREAGRFAIKGLGPEIAYAMVNGTWQKKGLILFMNAQAMAVYASLVSAESREVDPIELGSLSLEQEYLYCCFDCPEETSESERYEARKVRPDVKPEDIPVCRRLQFGRIPRALDEGEEALLITALNAAVELAGRKDYTPHDKGAPTMCAAIEEDGRISWSNVEIPREMEVDYPSLKIQDELALQRLRRQKESGATLSCALRILPMELEGDERRVPIVMVMLDDQQGLIGVPMIEDYEEEYAYFASEILSYMEEFGRPARIRTTDPRTFCLVSGFADQLNIPVEQGCSITEVNEVIRSFLEYVIAQENAGKNEKKEKNHSAKGRGVCLLCEREYAGGGMARHVKECVKKNRAPGDTEYFLIRVADESEPDFWMYLDVKADAKLKQIDQFLRDAWVECCGHMSAFYIAGETYCSVCVEPGERSMSARADEVLRKGAKFRYEYDFGSPTTLNLQVTERYTAKNRRKKVEVLARNIMPEYKCVCCGKRATVAYRQGYEPMAEAVYCEACAVSKEIPMLPLLNSPRSGVCGYGAWLTDNEDE